MRYRSGAPSWDNKGERMTYRKVYFVLLAALLVAAAALLGACGTATDPAGDSRDTTAASPVPAATGDPFIFGFDGGFTGFMAMDVELAEKGILTKLDMIQNQWMGRPVEYKKADNGSDPVVAVDKARQLVESDGIQFMAGPIFSPSAAAVTDYLAKAGGIPQCSIIGQPPAEQAFGGAQAVDVFLQALKATNGDSSPAALTGAMATLTWEGPTGKVTLKPYQDAFIPVRDFYMLKVQQVGDRVAWVPVYTYEQVELGE